MLNAELIQLTYTNEIDILDNYCVIEREKLPLKINDRDVALLLKQEDSQKKSFSWSMLSLVRIGETV